VEYAEKRAQLVAAAAIVFRDKGYAKATLHDVAASVGTDRASLYYYVGSKEELFRECVRGVVEQNLARARTIVAEAKSTRARLTELIEMLIVSYDESYPYIFVYIQENMSHIAAQDSLWATKMSEQTRRLERVYIDLIEAGMREGSFRSDLPAVLVANALFGMMNWTYRWYVPDKSFSTRQLAETFTSVLFEGVVSDSSALPV
jgi:AcrR family transcriptional regulator